MRNGVPSAWVPITPHATNSLPVGCQAIRVGSTAGDIVVRTAGRDSDTTMQVAAFEIVPGRFTHVRATGTTAGTLHAAV